MIFGRGCNTLKGVLQAVEKVVFFSTFAMAWVLGIHWFDQESVHRVSCIHWFGFLNMWLIGYLLVHLVSIFEMSKNCWIFLTPQISEIWVINWHKCVTICKFNEHFLGGLVSRAVAIRVICQKKKIFYLWHEGSMIGMQCHLVVCRVSCYPPNATFSEYLWITVFL